ncbi:hypothetical protein VP01_192g4 [Puccinia sorghi]|uniref:Uncharacterized protein n=1 Tax=Puccinia sorghi TaxID=27349 RepID=A0A0L6VCH5_9BASI|nr:hypothetical protein VP01_192g4 [Puccinia sorghi]
MLITWNVQFLGLQCACTSRTSKTILIYSLNSSHRIYPIALQSPHRVEIIYLFTPQGIKYIRSLSGIKEEPHNVSYNLKTHHPSLITRITGILPIFLSYCNTPSSINFHESIGKTCVKIWILLRIEIHDQEAGSRVLLFIINLRMIIVSLVMFNYLIFCLLPILGMPLFCQMSLGKLLALLEEALEGLVAQYKKIFQLNKNQIIIVLREKSQGKTRPNASSSSFSITAQNFLYSSLLLNKSGVSISKEPSIIHGWRTMQHCSQLLLRESLWTPFRVRNSILKFIFPKKNYFNIFGTTPGFLNFQNQWFDSFQFCKKKIKMIQMHCFEIRKKHSESQWFCDPPRPVPQHPVVRGSKVGGLHVIIRVFDMQPSLIEGATHPRFLTMLRRVAPSKKTHLMDCGSKGGCESNPLTHDHRKWQLRLQRQTPSRHGGKYPHLYKRKWPQTGNLNSHKAKISTKKCIIFMKRKINKNKSKKRKKSIKTKRNSSKPCICKFFPVLLILRGWKQFFILHIQCQRILGAEQSQEYGWIVLWASGRGEERLTPGIGEVENCPIVKLHKKVNSEIDSSLNIIVKFLPDFHVGFLDTLYHMRTSGRLDYFCGPDRIFLHGLKTGGLISILLFFFHLILLIFFLLKLIRLIGGQDGPAERQGGPEVAQRGA